MHLKHALVKWQWNWNSCRGRICIGGFDFYTDKGWSTWGKEPFFLAECELGIVKKIPVKMGIDIEEERDENQKKKYGTMTLCVDY